jgi:hypothetical protein
MEMEAPEVFAARVRPVLELFAAQMVERIKADAGFSTLLQGTWLKLVGESVPQGAQVKDQINEERLGAC